jgi:hypothetical protein
MDLVHAEDFGGQFCSRSSIHEELLKLGFEIAAPQRILPIHLSNEIAQFAGCPGAAPEWQWTFQRVIGILFD